jgi:predicted RNA-binding Zn ribbon-like protein
MLPSWVPSIETKPAPPPLLLVQSFVNTLETDTGNDLLAGTETSHVWLWETGLLSEGARLTDDDLARLREVREALRALIRLNGGHPGPTPEQLRLLDSVTGGALLRLRIFSAGDFVLEAEPDSVDPVHAVAVKLLFMIRDGQHVGHWPRLKACSNPDCGWAYYDRSHSRQGRWCDMSVCGNRVKNRALRARRR